MEVRPNVGREYGRRRSSSESYVAQNETLVDRVSRMKQRWLKRVMFDHGTSSSEKCFAYLVVDRLNCVTQDCWPSQKTIADQFGMEHQNGPQGCGWVREARSSAHHPKYEWLVPVRTCVPARGWGQICRRQRTKLSVHPGQKCRGILLRNPH